MPYLAATPLDPPVQSSARAWLDSIGISQLAVSKFLSKARSGAVTPRSDVATRGGDDVRTSYGEHTYTGGMASLSASSGSSVDADEVDDDAMVEPPDTLLPPMFDERSESPRSGSPSLPHRPPPVHSATTPPVPFRHAS
ncbi:hypothetical protein CAUPRSCDRAFT_12562 [Caulochytrium protostelioides]|uniref:Uncharacterized protein n=1 Tax=Caulochytrium protostelioides TaxID=1555241 RepID=A0A4P9WRA9_9FUNG|nr:hypothetical protein CAUPRSCDRAFT_12562 [Caulochytrium protostelioides]